MNKYFFSLLFLSLVGCMNPSATRSPGSTYLLTPLAKKFKGSQALLLSKQYDIKCCMMGGSVLKQLKYVSLGFNVNRKLSRDEGRAIVIDCVNQVIRNVYATKELQPYLLPEGFNEKNVEILLFINRNLGVCDPEIDTFSYKYGRFRYSTHQKDQEISGYYNNYYETYGEAIAILEEQGREDILLDASFKIKFDQEITSE